MFELLFLFAHWFVSAAHGTKFVSSNEILNRHDLQYSTIRTDIGPANSFEYKTKPPLAGPYAFSRIPRPVWDHPRIHLKHAIQNTWFFSNASSSGYVELFL